MSKVVAIGAGRMGRGIAQVFAFAGHKVSIIDFKDRTSEQTKYLFKESRAEIFQNLTLLCSIGLISKELIFVMRVWIKKSNSVIIVNFY